MNTNAQMDYSGSRWVRVDLHLHSPGVQSFKYPDNLNSSQKDEIVRRYVQQLKDQGIEVAAITDYQQIRPEWFIPIRDAAREVGIYVYPGVELSFGGGKAGKYGLHLLAIFPNDADIDKNNDVINKYLDDTIETPIIQDDGKHRELEPRDSLEECLPRFQQTTGCLFIFAHPNESSGLLKSYQPSAAANLVAKVQPEAIENFEKERKRLDNPRYTLSKNDLQRIASIENSDNHSIEEIGAKTRSDGTPRATWLKLSALDDLRAIRLALRDWEILARVGHCPQAQYTCIEAIEIDGAGFLGNLSLAFSPELNVLVGGRGTGKSALLETLRYALDLPAYSPTDYRENLIVHALGSGGKVSVRVRRVVEGVVPQRYVFERASSESPHVYRIAADERQAVNLPIADVLGEQELPLFFGQKEIYDVTKSPNLLRRLLDEIIGRTAQRQLSEIRKIEAELQQNARNILDRRQRLERREEIEKRLAEIEHEEQLFREQGILEKMERATALTRDEERLKRAQSVPESLASEWQDLKEGTAQRLQQVFSDLAQAESEQKSLLAEARQAIETLQSEFAGLLGQGQQTHIRAQSALDEIFTRWQSGRQPLDEEIRRVKQEFGERSLNPDRLIEMTSERQHLLPELERLKQIEQEIAARQDERRVMKERLREAYRKAFKLRLEQAEKISKQLDGRVRISVDHRGLRKEYAETLVTYFTGSKISRESLAQIAYAVPDGIELADLAHQGKQALRERTNISEKYADRLINFLNEKEERWFDLEHLASEDDVQIELNLNRNWQRLQKLSDGQRATAMLLILLTQSNRPMLVDQPEDDLDNRFIFDDVVQMLRSQKGQRQLIAATHNPNIPVLAHAELVLGLEAESDKMQITKQGGMDDHNIQDFVRKVMEGGEEAFRRRAEKYGMEI